jgi:hypothetical protein
MMSDDDSYVEFVAAIAQVRTMADGGLRFTFDTDECEIVAAAWLMDCKRSGVAVTLKISVLQNSQEQIDGMGKGRKRQSKWQTAQDQEPD